LWIERGADGWRLDVPNEIDDDEFWAEFRHTVKRVNREAYLLGEIWVVDPRWVGPRSLDGLMNYPLRKSLLDLVVAETLTAGSFQAEVEQQNAAYPEAHVLAQYNLLGSHDTERVATLAGEESGRLGLLAALPFFLPGAPAIYYGDEVGLTGGKDPESRAAFPWDPTSWDTSRRDLHKRLIALRHARPELRRGPLEFISPDEDGRVVAFRRRWGDFHSVILGNASSARQEVLLPPAATGWAPGVGLRDLLTGRTLGVGDAGIEISLGPFECMVLSSTAEGLPL
jgi:neopullulanase